MSLVRLNEIQALREINCDATAQEDVKIFILFISLQTSQNPMRSFRVILSKFYLNTSKSVQLKKKKSSGIDLCGLCDEFETLNSFNKIGAKETSCRGNTGMTCRQKEHKQTEHFLSN